MKHEITFFYSNINPEFSNLFYAPFEADSREYISVEHYFMYQKALTFDPDGEAIKKMGNHCTPKEMKKLGREVNYFDKEIWDQLSKPIMYRGAYEKFSQNPKLKEKLLATEPNLLAESAPRDILWGIGMGAANPKAQEPAQWRGKNWMGLILMAIRAYLLFGSNDILQRCTYEGNHLLYQSERQTLETNFFARNESGSILPDWKLITDKIWKENSSEYADIADLNRHLAYVTLVTLGIVTLPHAK